MDSVLPREPSITNGECAELHGGVSGREHRTTHSVSSFCDSGSVAPISRREIDRRIRAKAL